MTTPQPDWRQIRLTEANVPRSAVPPQSQPHAGWTHPHTQTASQWVPPVPAPRQPLSYWLKRLAIPIAVGGVLMVIGVVVDDDKPTTTPPTVGSCLSVQGSEPSVVACESSQATLRIRAIYKNELSSHPCAGVPGATTAFSYAKLLRVGGDQGIDVGTTEQSVICAGPK